MQQSNHIQWKKLLLALIALFILAALIASSWRNNIFVFSMLVLATIAVFLQSSHKKAESAAFVVSGILGPTMEMIIIHYGAWQYTNPSFGGIPLWLPLLWGLTGTFLMKIVRWLTPQ